MEQEQKTEFELNYKNNIKDIGDDLISQVITNAAKKIKNIMWYVLFPVFVVGFFLGAWVF